MIIENETVTKEHLDRRLAETRVSIVQWTIALLFGQTGLIIALQKLPI